MIIMQNIGPGAILNILHQLYVNCMENQKKFPSYGEFEVPIYNSL